MNAPISIAVRLRPFSHLPGARCLIPGTPFLVEAFPALIRLYDFTGAEPLLLKELPMDIQGPAQHFTVFQDLERGCVTVVVDTKRFHILPNLTLSVKKHPEAPLLPSEEQLSLGSHRKQEWEKLRTTCDFWSIFPLWFRLGATLSLAPLQERRGIFSLLDACESAIQSGKHEDILPTFRKLFLAGFSHLLVPRLENIDYQGIEFHKTEFSQQSPLHLLTEGASLIRSLFFKGHANQLFLLPHLPPEFFTGRFLNLSCDFGKLSIEWTKKALRRAYFRATGNGRLSIHLPSALQTFRVRTRLQEPGIVLSSGEEMEIKAGMGYLLDRFQK